MQYTIPFEKLNKDHVGKVGGKNASLGEMHQKLRSKGIKLPDGFATTAEAFRDFLHASNLEPEIQKLLSELDRNDFSNLSDIGSKIRAAILGKPLPNPFIESIRKSYRELISREPNLGSVAVRSSATAEDLPEASFAGQHQSFMNVKGEEAVIEAVHRCIASLYTDRAIKYREDHGFDHSMIALSAGVQKMVRSDLACSGVAFTLEPDTGFDKIVFINGSWGLGDNIVGGVVNADQYYLYKENLRKGCRAIIGKEPGEKEKTLVYGKDDATSTVNLDTPEDKRNRFVLTDDEITRLGNWCLAIERHYRHPMDIEWAKDGNTNDIYIVQARPETVHSNKKNKGKVKSFRLKSTAGKSFLEGIGIGNKIVAGKARIVADSTESAKLQPGEILVTEITNPDWEPIMKKAAAIITDRGGRTSHAAIVARELGVAAVVGTNDGTKKIKDGQEVTVVCEGTVGNIYDGRLEWEEKEIDLQKLEKPRTKVMLIMADPKQAFRLTDYPVDGVGLARMEFTISNSIKVHPLALIRFDQLTDIDVRNKIDRLTAPYRSKEEFFIERLAMAVSTMAASFYPRPVIVRMSDFKSNEYASLLGGDPFEPKEQNPMIGFRGASRYYHEKYKDGFRLECEAMKIVLNEMQLDNVRLMIPFCRTVDEATKVIALMEEFGLRRSDGVKIYMMVEIPSNVIACEKFAELFDGFSIGSNDLTQLCLGVDRDSELVTSVFSEQDASAKEMIAMAIRKAKKARIKIGLCGQAPSDFPEFAQFLVELKIDSISFNADALFAGIENIFQAERRSKGKRQKNEEALAN